MLGKSKDEHDGKITLHLRLKSNMYCCETDDKKATKKGKGIDRKVVRNKLTLDDFLYFLTVNKKSHYTSNKICSKNHHVFPITQNKVGLSSYDNKRFNTDNVTSIPYGHLSIN